MGRVEKRNAHMAATWIGFLVVAMFALPAAAVPPPLPLIAAVKASDAASARVLLDKRADVNASEPDGTTALHWAVRQDNADLAALLLDRHANVNAANRYGVTPLHLAAINGSSGMVGRLLDAGADPNAALDNGQ